MVHGPTLIGLIIGRLAVRITNALHGRKRHNHKLVEAELIWFVKVCPSGEFHDMVIRTMCFI